MPVVLALIRAIRIPAWSSSSAQSRVDPLPISGPAIHVRDLPIPEEVTLVTEPDDVVAKVLPPRVVEEEAPAAPEEGAEAVEEGAEGAPAEGTAAGPGGTSVENA